MNCRICGGSSPTYCSHCDGTGREPGVGSYVGNPRTGTIEFIEPMRPAPASETERRATEKDLLPDRNVLHKYMATKGSCDKCGGRGHLEDVFCECAAGDLRKKLEAK